MTDVVIQTDQATIDRAKAEYFRLAAAAELYPRAMEAYHELLALVPDCRRTEANLITAKLNAAGASIELTVAELDSRRPDGQRQKPANGLLGAVLEATTEQ